MKTALIIIATGEKYWKFVYPLIASAREFLVPHETLLFTDADVDFQVRQVPVVHLGWPFTTLMRYHTLLTQKQFLASFEQVFYIDVDSYFIAPVGSEIFSNGITAQIHPRLANRLGTYEKNPRSTAYVDVGGAYFLGALQGGESKAFLLMAETLKENIDKDLEWDHVAIWHDESHLNRYLLTHPPAKTLPMQYCYPEEWGNFEENEVKIVSPQKDSNYYHGY